jgi:hypothetical protein
VSLNTPSSWSAPGQSADYLVLTHASLLPEARALAEHRRRQGLRTAVADIEDLYDEFSFGHKDPGAIRRFLEAAVRTWRRPPRWVVLLGDATFDPRGYLGQGDLDLLPTKLLAAGPIETASDDWFADLDEDGVPDVAVGRLPARTEAEAALMIAKIIAYEGAGAAPGASLFVADGANGFDFPGASRSTQQLLPPSWAAGRIDTAQLGPATDDALAAALKSGLNLVNYLGHGSSEVWAHGAFSTAAARGLSNGRLPLWVLMTCLNGLYTDPGPATDCLAEALMKAEKGGAVAVWASSSLTRAGPQADLNQALYRALFGSRSITLGEAVVAAKKAVPDPSARRSWILFGDPALRVR